MPHPSEQIWRDHHAHLHRFIASRVSDKAEAEDILQDVFLRIHAQIDSLDDADRLQAWIYRIARNVVIDHYRRRRPSEPLPPDLRALEVEQADVHGEIGGCLVPMIGALPQSYRQALELTELQGRTQKALAEQEGLSLSGAKSRVQRARALVKAMLLECCHFEFNRQGQVVDYARKSDTCGPGCDSC